ncbi:MAG: FliM/FliN family flagellar motor switch protein [Rhodobacteraceae bacterium]|nr:FliM/FliN family flagellar motor switch protein [Paracoccaceae bacterium]
MSQDDDQDDVEDVAAEETPEEPTGDEAEVVEEDAGGEGVAATLEDVEEDLDEEELRERTNSSRVKRAVFGVPIPIVISVGRASPSIGDLMNMRRDTLIPLDTKIEDPVDIMIGKRVIARGELQELEDEEGRLGVRLTEIVDLSEPI